MASTLNRLRTEVANDLSGNVKLFGEVATYFPRNGSSGESINVHVKHIGRRVDDEFTTKQVESIEVKVSKVRIAALSLPNDEPGVRDELTPAGESRAYQFARIKMSTPDFWIVVFDRVRIESQGAE